MKQISRLIPLFVLTLMLGAAHGVHAQSTIGTSYTHAIGLAPQNVVMLTTIGLVALLAGAYVVRTQIRS